MLFYIAYLKLVVTPKNDGTHHNKDRKMKQKFNTKFPDTKLPQS